jgi:hypothetical protein
MGLVVALIVIGILVYILSRRNKSNSKTLDFNSKSLHIRILTIITIGLAIAQAPIFYYYTFGLFALFVVIPYLFISLILTGVLLTPLIKQKKAPNFQKYGVIIAVVIGTSSLIFGSDLIEKLDWKLRLKERNLIVQKALNGEIKDYKLKMKSFPPISNGGNEVFIDYRPEGSITVTFYIDRGFIDHYSAFIFTTDSSRIRQFDARTKSDWNKTNKKIDNNWYRISE